MNIIRGSCICLGLIACGCDQLFPTNPPPTGVNGTVFELDGQSFTVETVVEGLEVPWALGFTPDGDRMFVTERPGRLNVIDVATGAILSTTEVPNVAEPFPRSERGLMGLAVSPDFEEDSTVVVSYTRETGSGLENVIERYRLGDNGFTPADNAPIVTGLPASFVHDGLGLGFGPDGMLYASTGEATQADRAQELDFLGGKFLRMMPDGSVPDGNPFGDSLIWSLGHRNPQGFAFHPERDDVLIATEHGPSAGLDGEAGQDEINRIVAAGNYGWPIFRGEQTSEGFEAPLYQSGSDPIAPAGGTFCTGQRYPAWENAFLFVGLRGASLWVVQFDGENYDEIASIARGLQDTLGRLRGIAEGPDGYIYITTSNRDSRGTPAADDDRIVRLIPVED